MLTTRNDFERYVPNRFSFRTTADLVRISFQEIGPTKKDADSAYRLKVYIGKEIARKFNWSSGDRIAVEVSKSDPRTLRLIKTTENDLESYRLSSQPKQQYYSIILTWNKFIPESKDRMMRIIQHIAYEGGMIIYMH